MSRASRWKQRRCGYGLKKTRPKEETYNKLTRQRQMLADMVLAKLEEGTQQWTAGWRAVFDVGCESGTLYGLSLGYV